MGEVEGVRAAQAVRSEVRAGSDTGALAWLLAVPCAIVMVAVVALLGPPLGRLLHAGASPVPFWQEVRWAAIPELTEQGRFLLALGAPLLLALATVGAVRRGLRLPPRLLALGVPLVQALGVVLIAVCVVVQERLRFEVPIYQEGVVHRWRYFTPATLVAAAAFAAGAALVVQRASLRRRLDAWTRETSARRVAAVALAVLLTGVWLLHAVNTDASILGTSPHEWQPAQFTLDETFVVLNGRTPLVNFTPQYASLWPYATALALVAFGKTFLVFSIAMCALTAVALLAVYAILRRITRNGVTALLLYLPFLATSLFKVGGTNVTRYTFGDYFGIFPLRYAGPYLLAWLTARRLARGGPVGSWPLFTFAGLVVLNNVELGVAALGASVAAGIWTAPQHDARSLGRLAGQVAAGLLSAYALVAALTLARAGALPQLGRSVDYAREYAVGGFGLLPLPGVLGFHLVVYLTYVAALGTATVRLLDRQPDRLLTGMLAWSGVFGLGSASYYMGRTHPEALITTFSVWTLTLALLTIVVMRRLAGGFAHRPSIAALAVLMGMGLAVCSLAQLPLPWSQLDRLRAGTPATALGETTPPPSFGHAFLPDPDTRDFFASIADGRSRFVVRRGAPVALLLTTGHEIADAFGVVDISRYTGMYSMVTRTRLETVVRDLRAAGGNTLFLPSTYREAYELLAGLGFAPVTPSGLGSFTGGTQEEELTRVPWGETMVTKWVDTRALHPRFLREHPGGRAVGAS